MYKIHAFALLNGYDHTQYPQDSGWSFTRSYMPQAVGAGYQLHEDAPLLWSAFAETHHKHGLPEVMEIPMESFTRAVEIVLKESVVRDAPAYRPSLDMWRVAVRSCGYIQSRQAVSEEIPSLARVV